VDLPTVSGLRNLRAPGSGDLYARLVDLFRASSSTALDQLQTAVSAGSAGDAAAVCHKFAAAAANVGALVFAREVRRIEHLCTSGDLESARNAVPRLQQEHAALCRQLEAFKLRATA
jgi:HPt (histidine-containing phosphotransfer) domain-containing protein